MKARALLNTLAEADLRLLRIFVAIAESGGLATRPSCGSTSAARSSAVISRTWRRGSACGCANGPLGLCADRGRRHRARRHPAAVPQIEASGARSPACTATCAASSTWRCSTSSSPIPAVISPRPSPPSAPRPPGEHQPACVGHHRHREGLLEGQIQAAIHPFHRASESLRSWHLFSEQMWLYGSPGAPAAARRRPARRGGAAGGGLRRPGLPLAQHGALLAPRPAARGARPRAGRQRGADPPGAIWAFAGDYAQSFEQAGTLRRIPSTPCNTAASGAFPSPARRRRAASHGTSPPAARDARAERALSRNKSFSRRPHRPGCGPGCGKRCNRPPQAYCGA